MTSKGMLNIAKVKVHMDGGSDMGPLLFYMVYNYNL